MKIWVDITDLMAWTGHLTGIQRVVFNIAYRLQRDNDNVKFFYYDDNRGVFYEQHVDLSVWANSNSKSVARPANAGLKSKLVNFVPYKVKRITPKPVKVLALKTGKYAINKKRAIDARKVSKKRADSEIVASFQQKDTVMVLGNAWDKQNIIGDLGKLKQKYGFRLVNVVYDLIPIFEPQFFGGMVTAQYTNYIFEAVTNCDLLLPISHSTDRDIQKFCKMIEAPIPKTNVIRLGDEISEHEVAKKPSWLQVQKFVLCVGTIEIRKNHTLLYYAYKRLVNEGHKPPLLLIVGKRGWYTTDVMMLFEQDCSLKDYIKVAENVGDDELVWLYQNCIFTIYPSLYEGWGLPVAESLARGKVAICSNSSSVPEAGGALAIYFSPYDALSLSDLIIDYSSNIKKLKVTEQEIKSKYKVTAWEDTYKQVVNLINKT